MVVKSKNFGKFDYLKILPEFQDFLLEHKFCAENQAPFYAYRAWQFERFALDKTELSVELKKKLFLDSLAEDENVADWQLAQADDALRIYFERFGAENEGRPIVCAHEDLINRCRQIIRLRHYSLSTERTYIDWIKKFFAYLNSVKKKDAQELQGDDIKDYLSYLAVNKRVSASTQNQAFNALLFLCKNVLHMSLQGLEKTVRAKRGIRVPVVLTLEEITSLFQCIEEEDSLYLELLYGTGMRLKELVRLRVQDIDFSSNTVFIRASKGDKDRTTVLPRKIRPLFKKYISQVKQIHEEDIKKGHGSVYLPHAISVKFPNAEREWGWQYVFPAKNLSVDPRTGAVRRHHLNEKTVQIAMRAAVKKAGIIKHATVHTLRHSFATHLLQSGVNIREIQDLLGHRNIETTMVYTHVLRNMHNTPQSPLDMLYNKTKQE